MNALASTPTVKISKKGWLDKHNLQIKFANNINSEIIIIGDSIVAGFSRYQKV